MVQDWFENNIFTYIVIGIFAAGFLTKCLISLKYRMLIRASRRMGTSKNKLMRLLRLKFETCYKIKLGVNNVDTFVDKYVYRHRFCGIRLYTWETISGEFVLLCALSASVFALLGAFYECGRKDILSTLSVGIVGSALLVGVDFLVNIKMKRVVLRTNIKDYLENFLKARLESSEFSPELLEQYKREYFDLPKNHATLGSGKEKKDEKAVSSKRKGNKDRNKEEEDANDPIRRREARKRELKQLIAEDKKKEEEKKNGKKKGAFQEESSPYSKPSQDKKEALAQQETAASRQIEVVQKTKKPEQEEVKISAEEAEIIEDILKEYLS